MFGRLISFSLRGVTTKTFTVIIKKDEDSGYFAYVPSLQGCHTQADTIDDLVVRIKEAITLCYESQDFYVLLHTKTSSDESISDMEYFSSIPGYLGSITEASEEPIDDCIEDIGWNIP